MSSYFQWSKNKIWTVSNTFFIGLLSEAVPETYICIELDEFDTL